MNINFYDLTVAFHKKCPFHFKKEGGKNNRNSSNNLCENLRSSQFMPLLMCLHKVFKGKKDPLVKQTFVETNSMCLIQTCNSTWETF